ncbi:MAG: phage tail assembly protein [Anaerolineae bacterium]|nr:phage tail assembly protein [Anaerolineae bacterium]
MMLQTEFEFALPHGYVDDAGQNHRLGRMRLATALDEVESVAHPRVQSNDAYLPIVLLSRVITQLGSLSTVTPRHLEQLFAADLAYLEDLYLRLNSYDGMLTLATCPNCGSELHLKVSPPAVPSAQYAGDR